MPLGNLELSVAILEQNLKGPTASFDEMGLCALRSAWEDVKIALALPELSSLEEGWRPIESAPIGERVFLWCADTSWNNAGSAKEAVGVKFGAILTYGGRPRPRAEGMSGDWTFTHWRPLPAPPVSLADGLGKEGLSVSAADNGGTEEEPKSDSDGGH